MQFTRRVVVVFWVLLVTTFVGALSACEDAIRCHDDDDCPRALRYCVDDECADEPDDDDDDDAEGEGSDGEGEGDEGEGEGEEGEGEGEGEEGEGEGEADTLVICEEPPPLDTVCDPVAQCGCSNGLRCVDFGDADFDCYPGTGLGGQAAPCDEGDDCAGGFGCVAAAGDEVGVCLAYCYDDADCAGVGDVCGMRLENTILRSCAPQCDALTGVGCPGGMACHVFFNPEQDRFMTGCRDVALAPSPDFGECDAEDECRIGSHCGATSPPRCYAYCHVDADCDEGTCEDFSPAAVIDGVRIGVCFL